MHKAQRLINHVVLVLDASYSMKGSESELVSAVDSQIQYLAKRSSELDQETRVSVYHFGHTTIECLIFDMDVMRLPSAKDLYRVLRENTALIDATLKAQRDLETTSQLYGDHAFLTFVMTDGQENYSRQSPKVLSDYIYNMPDNWSLGFLVPDQEGVEYVESRLGVLRDSIAIWDTALTGGIKDAVSAIRTATDNFMQARTKGVRGTRSVFSTGVAAVNDKTVSSTLMPLAASSYELHPVKVPAAIRPFVEKNLGLVYKPGNGFYQLTKTETIQARKSIIVVDKKTGQAYSGTQARALVGLPDKETRVRPDYNPKYDIYVQSTSVNRKLLPNTKLLLLK